MSSSRQVRAADDPLPKASPGVVCSPPSERHPVKEETGAGAVVAQESIPPCPWDWEEDEATILENEERIKKKQSILAAYLKDKYKFLSTKAVDRGDSSCTGEAKNLEHEEKNNKFRAILAARLKDIEFSRKARKAFDKGDALEEITTQSETIQISRDPAKICQEEYSEKNM
ncbi:uncharacterized protein LOC106866456 [Brachypodium distachyon]|uniref:Uncharacterized protein n=1 Tax=Brachypodium distachyon TaxID=15368 RepID=A0A2K2D229_BRADI|nr:uncharacterized protein LOC106866456 [Brachypodium distachyon]PNT68325.1 hypothetical protein BRADI_3g38831v3 [Brachypodium distachyon]|eukprot:XP_014756185.1 uncharacterized protein LOC106866456 [Brachypodium distachyon]